MPVADFKTYCAILDRARDEHYALPAANVTSLTTANAVLRGLAESKADGIIQISTGGGARDGEVTAEDPESAMGKYPEEAVAMLAKIAAYTETHRPTTTINVRRELAELPPAPLSYADCMTAVMERALETVPCDLVLVPTRSGATARLVARLKPSRWLIAPSPDHSVCQGLAFSYGVHAVENANEDSDWRDFIERWMRANYVTAQRALLIAGPSPRNPQASHRIELIRLGDPNE